MHDFKISRDAMRKEHSQWLKGEERSVASGVTYSSSASEVGEIYIKLSVGLDQGKGSALLGGR